MGVDSLKEILKEEIRLLYSAESQLTKAFANMAEKASSPSLQKAFLNHLKETEGHLSRLESMAGILDMSPTGKVCRAMTGLIEETNEIFELQGEKVFLDIMLVAAARRIEHYEMAGYNVLCTIAEELGENEIVDLVEETLKEERAADELFSDVSEDELYALADLEDEDEEEALSRR